MERPNILVVVDIQNDFCPGGRLAVPDGDAVVPVINRLAERFDHIVCTQDWHPAGHSSFASSHPGKKPYQVIQAPYGPQILWPDHCIQGSPGAQFRADLHLDRAELIIRKGFRREVDSYSTFYENDHTTPTGLGGYLRERGFTRVYLAGLALDFCVAWSALDARREGFEVVAIEDACRPIDVEGSLAKAMADMRAAGATITNSGAVAA
jgi:nicotinamidase/pyrazinamidase